MHLRLSDVLLWFDRSVLSRLIIWIFLALGSGFVAKGQITANFTADSTTGCEQLLVNFSDLSTGTVTSWTWAIYNDVGAVVGFSSLEDPSFVFDIPGNYDVELTVCGPAGCDTRYLADYLVLFDAPEVLYTASAFSGCPPVNISFTDVTSYSSGAFLNRFWVIEGGPLLPTSSSINYTFTAPGIYDVLLLIEDDNGCSAFYEDSVEIFAPPAAVLSATDYSACNPPLSTTFSAAVTGTPPYTYSWDFGDGSTSTLPSPSHTYTSSGNFNVSLTITDGQGCTATIAETNFIQVFPADVQFSTATTVGCVGQPLDFINTSTPSSGTWVWNFGDGSPVSGFFSPSHTYATPGTYTVSLLGSFGSGCSDNFTQTIVVQNPPTGDFTASTTEDCQVPTTVSFSSSPGPSVASYLWTFGDGSTSTAANPNHTYTAYGTYTVTLTMFDAAGCSIVVTKSNFISIQPLDVGFVLDPEDGCAPLTILFADTTSGPSPITTWFWTFGTGATATAASPSYTYTTPGCYDVSLTVTSATGCTATLLEPNFACAGSDNTAFFTVPDTSCPAVLVGVGAAGLDAVEVFVDGGLLTTIPTPSDPMLIPNIPNGLHDLTLVSYDNGCPDTLETSIFILAPIDSVINVIRDCANPYQVTFILQPSVADSSCGWEWDLGDGTIVANVDTLVYTYATPGFYVLNIEVFCFDLGTCGTLAAGGITITDPVADFTPAIDFSCSYPVAINFEDNSTDGFNDDLIYAWSFGDGGTSFVSGPTRNYTVPGEFVVSVVITDVNGCTDSHVDTVNISQLQADLSWTALCSPLDVEITDATVAVGGAITSWSIDYGDGTSEIVVPPASLGTVIHSYPTEGEFNVQLLVTNEFGCSDNVTVEVSNTFLRPDFLVNDAFPCAGQSINFINLSIGTGLTYFWDFGVPGVTDDTSNLFGPSFAYPYVGTFSPSLVITDVNGCTQSLVLPDFITTDTLVVEPFDWTTLIENCNFALVEFRPNALDTAEACSYFWNFGDGGVSVERTPIYPYVLAGEYNVSLTITNCNGCSDIYTVSNAITVIGPFGNFSVSDDSICIGQTILFEANVVKSDSIFLFAGNGDVFGTDIPFSDTVSTHILSYAYSVPGTYTPQIVIKDTTGCFSVLHGDSIFVGSPSVAAFDLPIAEACLGEEFPLIDLTVATDPVTGLSWSFTDTTLAGALADTTFFTPLAAGLYPFQLLVETAFGCVDSAAGSFNVLPLPAIGISPDTSVCPGLSTQLLASGGIAYSWSPATGLSDPLIANPFANPILTTTYTVVVDDGSCVDSAQVTVTAVEELPIVFGTDTTLCLGQSAPLFVELPTGLPGDVLWSWSPVEGLDDPSSLNPIATPLVTTTYAVSVSCGDLTNVGEVDVVINAPPIAAIVQGDTTIFPGESVSLPTVVGGGGGLFAYTWTPPIDLSCTDCDNPVSTPNSDIEYVLFVQDQFGCSDSASVRINLREDCGEGVFEIANIITPNGDGANDVFSFRYEGISEILAIRIFDRWGGIVFETQDVETQWNGTCSGKFCTPGVYVYTIEAVCDNLVNTILAGNVTLIR